MLRHAILTASRSPRAEQFVRSAPISRDVVRRFVAGETELAAVQSCQALVADGLHVSLDRLGEDTLDAGQAETTVKAYVGLLGQLVDAGLAAATEVSVKLSAVGQALDESLAFDNAAVICDAAASAGTTVTLDMEDHTTTDSTLAILRSLRADFPTTGAVIQSYLHRSEADCRDLAYPGSRVRLCKGAYREPETVAFQSRADVDASYLRCLSVLMAGDGYPMVASHDPAMISAAGRLAHDAGRGPGSFEYQMLYGVRPAEQRRLAAGGDRVRVYVPYGDEWYGYLMRRLAERPANLKFFARSLLTRS